MNFVIGRALDRPLPSSRDGRRTIDERVEVIEPRIRFMRVLIVDNLHRYITDLSTVARRLPGFRPSQWLRRERAIAALAVSNIVENVRRLVHRPVTRVVHLSELSSSLIRDFAPDAIVLSGTLSDFDLYEPRLLANLKAIVKSTSVPVLGICGGHQLIGMFWGADVVTLDGRFPSEKRQQRLIEYGYRFVKVVRPDPIFAGVNRADEDSTGCFPPVLKVWQNHGLKLDRVPDGFTNLARSYLCDVQMLVKRSEGQLMYTVQFHIEKSFEDWHRHARFWTHRVESRHGRIIFGNFLRQALKHRRKEHQLIEERTSSADSPPQSGV